MRQSQQIGVVGAGAWGTALAQLLAAGGHDVRLWAYEPDVAADINEAGENRRYLPGIILNKKITAVLEGAALADCQAVLLVCPAQFMRATLNALAPELAPGTPAVLCAKGIERDTLKLMHEVLAECAGQLTPAVLSGPSFAIDVAQGLPTAVTLACEDKTKAAALVAMIGQPNFRPYVSDDIIGAEIGGAVKNVLAIACGIVDGKGFGESARAALSARGFAEMTRLGLALGARLETLGGLSGLGDLILTCGSLKSRNMSLGVALGRGEDLDSILSARETVSEGVFSAAAVCALAKKHAVDMPIAAAVAAIVAGEVSVDQAIEALLARPFKAE